MNIKNLLSKKIICSTFAIILSACGSDNKNTEQIKPPKQNFDFQALLEKSVETAIPGVVLYIDSPNLQFHGAAGIADIETQTPMQIDARIPNGSAGKKLTALLAAMLVEEQQLDLDKPITEYLPTEITSQIAHANNITTRHMLQHTAGLIDYLNETDGAFYQAVLQDPQSIKTDEFAMQFVYEQKANFAPGTNWSYSNTGYILTGLVLDQILAEHHSKAMRNRIFEPFGLNSMSYGGIEKAYDEFNSGYFLHEGELINTKQYYQNIGVADAPVVGTAKDMADLLKIIVTGELLSQQTHQLMIGDSNFVKTGSDGIKYGFGLFKESINGKEVIHHGGSELGYRTYNFYIKDTKTSMAMLINCNYQKYNTDCDEAHKKLNNQILNELTK